MTEQLRRMFWPSSVAVVGASPDLGTYGGQTLDMLLGHGFGGRLIPVNPKHQEIAGLPTVPSIAAIDEPIDLAVIVVPAAAVSEVVGHCAEAGVTGVAIFSSGFAETDLAGAARQAALLARARTSGMRVLGPNCQGFFNVHAAVAATFSPAADLRRGLDNVRPGNVAVVSQSGALGFAVFHAGTKVGVGFSHVITCGNSADVSILDAIDLLIDDDHTDAILVIMEGTDDGARFREVASRAARSGTRLVVSKLGRSTAGNRAAATHTAHLAGSSAAYDAVFERHGVLSARDLEEIVDLSLALSRYSGAPGPRVAVVSTSGGAGVWMADACDDVGLDLPEVGRDLGELLSSAAPATVRPDNPLDLTGRVLREANVSAAVRAFIDDESYDVVVLVTSLSDPLILAREAEAFAAVVADSGEKPLLVFTYTQPSPAGVDLLTELNLPWATSPRRVARMISHLVTAGRGAPEVGGTSDLVGPPASSFAFEGRNVLSEPRAKRFLRAWGAIVPEGAVVDSSVEASRVATEIKGPVAMKVVSTAVAHKSDIGGVALDVDPERVEHVYHQLVERATQVIGADGLDGVLVEAMAKPGHEFIVGVLTDDTFGPLLMVGSGGVDVEASGDTQLLPLPVDEAEAGRAISRLRSAALLSGTRGRPPADVAALTKLLVRVAAIAEAGTIAEMDLNPVVVHEAGTGVTVVDAWLVLNELG